MSSVRLAFAIVAGSLYFLLGIAIGTFVAIPVVMAFMYMAAGFCGAICYWTGVVVMCATIFGVAALVAFCGFKAIRGPAGNSN